MCSTLCAATDPPTSTQVRMGMDYIELLLFKQTLNSIHGATSMLHITAPDLYHFHHEHPVVTFTKWGFGSSGVPTVLEGHTLLLCHLASTGTHSEASSRGRATQTRLSGGIKDKVSDGRTRMLVYSIQGAAITEVDPMMLTASKSFQKRIKANYQHPQPPIT